MYLHKANLPDAEYFYELPIEDPRSGAMFGSEIGSERLQMMEQFSESMPDDVRQAFRVHHELLNLIDEIRINPKVGLTYAAAAQYLLRLIDDQKQKQAATKRVRAGGGATQFSGIA